VKCIITEKLLTCELCTSSILIILLKVTNMTSSSEVMFLK
jgi:hypothetical protein